MQIKIEKEEKKNKEILKKMLEENLVSFLLFYLFNIYLNIVRINDKFMHGLFS